MPPDFIGSVILEVVKCNSDCDVRGLISLEGCFLSLRKSFGVFDIPTASAE